MVQATDPNQMKARDSQLGSSRGQELRHRQREVLVKLRHRVNGGSEWAGVEN
jgi:hypothetical protein